MRIEPLDFSIDLMQVLQWMRNHAVNLQQTVENEQAWYDENHTQFWQDWVRDVFDLRTANAFGLAVWCIILDVPYFLQSVPPLEQPVWGFNETPPINNNVNFDNGNFAAPNYPKYVLTVEEQRIVLRLRYFDLITRGAIPEINAFLDLIFNDPDGILQGGAWAIDNFDMTMMYTFNCAISVNLYRVLTEYDIMPRPAAVGVRFIVTNDHVFGFNTDPPSNRFVNFDNGCFAPENYG